MWSRNQSIPALGLLRLGREPRPHARIPAPTVGDGRYARSSDMLNVFWKVEYGRW
jgi:hypothetical protein